MILDKKAKDDFLRWIKKRCNVKLHELSKVEIWFSIQDVVFKNSILLEWFDSVAIFIDVNVVRIYDKNSDIPKCSFSSVIFHTKHWTSEGRTLTQLNLKTSRRKATEQAIIKANEIYNHQDQ